MFERFDEPARRALFHSRRVAGQMRAATIQPLHLLGGVWVVSSELFGDAGSRASVERAFAGVDPSVDHPDEAHEIAFADASTRVVVEACAGADALGQHAVGPADLLLAILEVDESETGRTLQAAGIDAAGLRRFLDERPTPGTGAEVADAPLDAVSEYRVFVRDIAADASGSSASAAAELAADVNAAIKAGWVPQGGIAVVQAEHVIVLAQAMVRRPSRDATP